jgi:tetratricopeptide (TPR) repeat protein
MIIMLESIAIQIAAVFILWILLQWICKNHPKWRNSAGFIVALGRLQFENVVLPVFTWTCIAIVCLILALNVALSIRVLYIPYLINAGIALLTASINWYNIFVALPLLVIALIISQLETRSKLLTPGQQANEFKPSPPPTYFPVTNDKPPKTLERKSDEDTAHAQGIEWDTLTNEVRSLYQKGQYDHAVLVAKKALDVSEKEVGPSNLRVATSMNNLAVLYGTQGQYAEAEALFKHSLAQVEKALGPDHPDVATRLSNLALVYKNQGRYAEAEALYKRSLSIREKALGHDHPDVALTLNDLALLYKNQGRYAEAESLYKRSLSIREKALGPDHPKVADTLNNLAVLYDTQGQYGEAEALYKRSLSIREKALGPDHPKVATSLENMAELYRITGRVKEAESLEKRAARIREITAASMQVTSENP